MVRSSADTYIEMNAMTFDSLTYARRLKASGFTEQQAETLADATRDVFVADFAANFATKADLTALEQRLTLRIGGMLLAGFGVTTAIIGVLLRLH
jgi:hypothetical protein